MIGALKSWLRRRSKRLQILLLFMVFSLGFSGLGVGTFVATSRSNFCSNCHIMEPYIESWKHSSHADVECIQCHFPPTLGGKVHAKFVAINQLVSYITGVHATIPYAEVSNESCQQCHAAEDIPDVVDFDGISFKHSSHQRALRGDKNLRCTSCHTQITNDEHMTVYKASCFLCHFKESAAEGLIPQNIGMAKERPEEESLESLATTTHQPTHEPSSNESLHECKMCHQVPQDKMNIDGVEFDHGTVEDRGMKWVDCHRRTTRGDGKVKQQRCYVCHNLKSIISLLEDKENLHKIHVSDHAVSCLSCHDEIEHVLPEHKSPETLDCNSCHGDHHRDSLNLYFGEKDVGKNDPSPMAKVRVDCHACHQKKEGVIGREIHRANGESCDRCHGEGYKEKYDEWI